ncbi:MAG: DUF642 domain-containing protein [Gemmatimonadaceae bacterium]
MKTYAFVFATFLLSGSLGAQVVNGGFETPAPPSGSYTLYNSGGSIGGWDVVGTGNVAVVSGSFAQNGISFGAQSGAAWLDLTGLSNSAAGVQQSIATSPGTAYDVSFWVGNVVNPSGIFGTTSTVVNVNGGTSFTAVNSGGVGTNALFWQQFTTSFVASSASTTISFTNGDASSDNSNGLDNVSVSAQSTVPEPTSVALLATGLIGLVPMIRRKR